MADALQKVDCYFQDFSQNMFFMSYERQRRYSIIYDNECKNIVLVSPQINIWLANTKMSQKNMHKLLTEALIHEFNPFVF